MSRPGTLSQQHIQPLRPRVFRTRGGECSVLVVVSVPYSFRHKEKGPLRHHAETTDVISHYCVRLLRLFKAVPRAYSCRVSASRCLVECLGGTHR